MIQGVLLFFGILNQINEMRQEERILWLEFFGKNIYIIFICSKFKDHYKYKKPQKNPQWLTKHASYFWNFQGSFFTRLCWEFLFMVKHFSFNRFFKFFKVLFYFIKKIQKETIQFLLIIARFDLKKQAKLEKQESPAFNTVINYAFCWRFIA